MPKGIAPVGYDGNSYSAWPRVISVPAVTVANVEVGTHTFLQSSSAFFGGYRSLINLADSVSWHLPLKAGTWTLETNVTQASSGGRFEVYINGALVTTVDTYNGAGGTNRAAVTGIVIPSSGLYTVRFLVVAKNDSSSGVTCRISGFSLALPGAL